MSKLIAVAAVLCSTLAFAGDSSTLSVIRGSGSEASTATPTKQKAKASRRLTTAAPAPSTAAPGDTGTAPSADPK